jgi:serine/threonine-protein kinase
MANSERASALGRRYVLDEPIATGTTATIWRGHDRRTGRQVAIKRFHQHLFADATARRRMRAEAAAARRVRGRTVVAAIDTVATRDEFALVFPFIDGTPLAERLHDGTPLPAPEAGAIAADIADALTQIQGAQLVHRDVKPGNVLLADDGRAVLLDFGISRSVTDAIEADQQLTGAGLAIGTLPYMAPEQLMAGQPTSATDVYALGVLLYQMLSGRLPFDASSPVSLATEQRLPPARIDGVPEPLMDLTQRALSIEPTNRPSAREISVALRSWVAAPAAVDAPTSLLPATTAATASVPPARNGLAWRPLALAAVGALLVGVVALAASSPTASPANTPSGAAVAVAPQPTSTPRPKRTEPPTKPATSTPFPAATPNGSTPTASPPPASTSDPKPHPDKPKHGHHRAGGHHGRNGHHGHHRHKHHRHH